nr:dynein heavy chain 7, axonemal-like [Lepeophtheirus salmonis]
MFKNILFHLFGLCPPDPIPDDVLKKAIIDQCQKHNLESTPYFLSKVQQLYDMMDLCDGVMLLGGSFGGKTLACKILASGLNTVSGKSPHMVVVNPKAIKIDQMYGYFDNDEWVDGILAKNFRQFTSLPSSERKWLIFDGPIDSSWIENMNTVLDETKKLCLMSGEIIRLPPNTNLIFEAQDVETAAPATISRCGVLYMDPHMLDWNLIVKNWIKKFPSFITDHVKDYLKHLFLRFCKPSLKIAKKSTGVKTTDHHLIQSLINIFDCYLNKLIESSELKGKSDNELIPVFEGIFYFSCIWSIGGICHEDGKKKFNSEFKKIMYNENNEALNLSDNVINEENFSSWEPTFPLPREDQKTVFDFKLIVGTKPEWQKWDVEVSNISLPRDIYACQLNISTCETVKYNHLMNMLVENSKPFLLIGSSGTGKSSYVKNMLHNKLDPDKFSYIELYFTSVSSPTVTQSLVMSKLDKRRKGVYGPALGKKFLIFVDDINSPQVDEVGSQPPIELLRQLLDRKVWYDLKELSPIKLVDMIIIGAMRLPIAGVQGLPTRFFRHFNTIHMDLFSDETIRSIFSRIVLWHLDTKGFSKEFDPCINQVINATLGVHKFVVSELLPTPKHSHYLFSLKEFSRVICGVLLSVPETMTDLLCMKRLWVHEILRVYYDRLVHTKDRDIFLNCVKAETRKNLMIDFDELFGELKSTEATVTENDLRKLMFCDFGDSKNSEEDKFYKSVTDIDHIRRVSEDLLDKYNQISRKPMDLVLFDFALEHLCRISRVLKQPESHMIFIGLGGSGRQSLSRLAAHISGFEFHQIELGKDDELYKWKSELKTVLKKTSLKLEPSILFLYDSQILVNEYLEDINNILLSGEVPNLFSLEEKLEIVENMKNLEKDMDKSMHTDGSLQALFSLFVKRIKENMHIIFAMSPTSNSFRRNLVRFPALMDRCTINWFHQWPNDALNFVSNKFLMGIDFRPGELKSCVSLCEFFHNSSIKLSKKMSGKVFNYVTPASYLELNLMFKKHLREHRKKVCETQKKYEISLEKLKGAESQVSVMQTEMNAIQPKLVVASKDVDEVLSIVDKEQYEVTEQDKILKSEESIVNEKKKLADTIRSDCESELAEVTSFVEASLEMISSLSQSELSSIRGMKGPTISLKLNTEALCCLKGIKSDKIPDPSGVVGKMIDDFWGPTKRLLADPKFLESFYSFDKDNLNPKVMKIIREKYLSQQDMNPDKSKSSVTAADLVSRAMFRWIQSLDMYEKVARNIAPKRETLTKADTDFQESLENLTGKKEILRRSQEKLKIIMNDLQEKKQRKAELENEVELCSRKLERAEQLITGFGNERENWSNKAQFLSAKYFQLTGDILLSVGIIAYLGPFFQEIRDEQIQLWQKKAKELNITFSEDFSLQKILGDSIQVQTWYMSGLLQDKVSTDNGIIMNTVERWPMMIDPQDIANRWIKSMEKHNNLNVIKQSDKDFIRTLESCIQFGSPVLLENIGDTLDPVLEPLLQKQTFQQGGSVCIKLGESTIEYSKSFKMYITTRYNNPHFPPEISSKISLINFAITTSGLIDQLLGVIIARERPELEEERSQVIIQINDNHKNIVDIQNKILDILFSSKGNILEDENAIKTLSSSKLLANEISEKQSTSQSNKERIEENRNEYLDLAKYAVTLFFTSISLSNINTMYQFSSTWFINIFCTSIDLADKSDELGERLLNIKNHFLKNLYINTSRGLFEVDKVLYSFLLVANLNPDPGFKDSNMWKTFLLNGYNMKEREDHFPASSTLLNEDLRCKLTTLYKTLKYDIDSVSEEMTSFFNSLWISQDPTSITSSKYDNPFESLTITSYIRPDKTLSSIRKYVVDLLGPTFLSQEQTDIGKSYAESTHATPIIFILGDDVDPTNIIYKFADSMGYGGKKLRIISMGKGLEEKAEETIKESVLTGSWVVLMNCHLIPEWMDDLEYICEGLNKESTNTDFRLWISTRPIKSFSVPTLQISVKIALEESSNLKLNIIRYILSDNSVRKVFDNSSITYKKLVFILAIIHAALNERRIYSQCGWNGNYIFGEQDVELCKFHLESVYQSSTEEISGSALSTLQYLISACSYGGRMEDEWDQRTLDTFIHSILQIDILQLINDLDISGIYHLKDLSDFKTTESYIMNLPTETNHNILRMGEATHYLKNVLEGETFLHKLRLTQREEAKIPESNKKMEDKEDEFIKMRQTMSKILNLLPEEFETTENNSFSEDKILNIVLDQELQKYNDLLDTMKESLESAIMSIDGRGIMTKEIQELLEFIKNDEIPSIWMNMAYPILESMSGFLEDLRLRTAFLLNWQTHGPPKVYWLTALFEPGDFFIAILYLHSLKMGIPFHELTLECKFDQNADEGILVKDLYLVGAHWNDEKSCITDSDRQNIYCKMPVFRVVPVSFDDLDDNSKTVNIPMFQNSEKSGEDNFVIDLNLPSEHSEEECILKGVAILCQKPLDC